MKKQTVFPVFRKFHGVENGGKGLWMQVMRSFFEKDKMENHCKTDGWLFFCKNLSFFSKNLLTEGEGAGIVRLLS
ncbi:hypothetical protein [Pseudogulbenkiania ferrooxidans]|uniref:hypothetical protein n=1 Tax=Pseudogulbenkiania ferrooxidans TaxID=549169 RepID=UPI0012681DE7|nr:hypothetical protein [Pseudogulbenkiania ferrooxidans]